MTDHTFDPETLIAASRKAFAPALAAQHEGFKSFERLTRLQYALAGDVLESGLARVNAAFAATSPTELLQKHSELNNQLAHRLRTRAEEFASVTSEIQAKFSEFSSDIVGKAVPTAAAA
jgi:phasin family protein